MGRFSTSEREMRLILPFHSAMALAKVSSCPIWVAVSSGKCWEMMERSNFMEWELRKAALGELATVLWNGAACRTELPLPLGLERLACQPLSTQDGGSHGDAVSAISSEEEARKFGFEALQGVAPWSEVAGVLRDGLGPGSAAVEAGITL